MIQEDAPDSGTMQPTDIPPIISQWREKLGAALDELRAMAGATEGEFLQIGAQLQSFYERSVDITGMAGRLVAIVSGEHLQSLIERLRQMMADMEQYHSDARQRNGESFRTLEQVRGLLEQLVQPLQGFQKMNKTLRMLSISTKIESSRLGELGSGFLNLAMDVERLSHQVNDRSATILAQRQELASAIISNLATVHSSEASQNAEVRGALASTSESLRELVDATDRFAGFGTMVSEISAEVSSNISEVVMSQQTHDITRQQIEHVVEAIEKLVADLEKTDLAKLDLNQAKLIAVEAGDVCELQEAQLRFATTELHTAVCSIVDNLRDVAAKQTGMAHETLAITGSNDTGNSTFVDSLKQGMAATTLALSGCARSDRSIAETMRSVASTVQHITGFVEDIEHIGSEIDLIALNSQIKAAHTGSDGAALGVLAEAIKRLSDEAIRQTESVTGTLTMIRSSTECLSIGEDEADTAEGGRIMIVESELSEIIAALEIMNNELFSLAGGLGEIVQALTVDVEQATSGIDVHHRIKSMADEVLTDLELIVTEARRIEPASTQFMQNLRHMEEHYTMESERHIHEAIARKRAGHDQVVTRQEVKDVVTDEFDLGANVDLF